MFIQLCIVWFQNLARYSRWVELLAIKSTHIFAEQQRCFGKNASRTIQNERKISQTRERYEGFSPTKFWVKAELWKGITYHLKICWFGKNMLMFFFFFCFLVQKEILRHWVLNWFAETPTKGTYINSEFVVTFKSLISISF